MAQPTGYTPKHAFVADSATVPNFPGQALDVEFNGVKSVTDQIRANLALIQRDDGAPANGTVTFDTLSTNLQTAGLAPATAWATGTAYQANVAVTQSSNLYRSVVAHTAGTFATDLAAGKWLLVSALLAGPTGPAGPANTLAIGTVTAGAAAAAITGSAPAQTLNLTLQTGATGPTGLTGPGYGGTSATSLAIANSVTKVFTTQSGLAYQVGNYVRATSAASGLNYMEGNVTDYTGTSLSIAVVAIGGSGTFADWTFATAGVPGTAGGGSAANPTGTVGLTTVNGSAITFLRSDGSPPLSVAIIPTWTGQHTFSNATISAQFSGGPVGIKNGATAPTAQLHVGDVAAASSGANILSARASTGASSVHGIAENSTINLSASGQGMDSYDARMVVNGTQTYDHLVSYQSRAIYGSSGIITNAYGGWDQFTANGPVTNQYGWYVALPTGTSTITNSYGFYCEALTKGGTLNYAFFSAGTTPSKFGGNVDAASFSVAGLDATGAWTAYTPTVSAQTGTFTTTTATGRWKQVGKTVFFSAQLTITTNGTAAGYVILGLPTAAHQLASPGIVFSGMRSGLIGLAAIIDSTTTIDVVDASTGAYPGATGRSLYITGMYEAA